MFYPTALINSNVNKLHKGTLYVTCWCVVTENVAQCHADFIWRKNKREQTKNTKFMTISGAKQLYKTETWLFQYLDIPFLYYKRLHHKRVTTKGIAHDQMV